MTSHERRQVINDEFLSKTRSPYDEYRLFGNVIRFCFSRLFVRNRNGPTVRRDAIRTNRARRLKTNRSPTVTRYGWLIVSRRPNRVLYGLRAEQLPPVTGEENVRATINS